MNIAGREYYGGAEVARYGLPYNVGQLADARFRESQWEYSDSTAIKQVVQNGDAAHGWILADNKYTGFYLLEQMNGQTFRLVIYQVVQMPDQRDDYLLPVKVKYFDFDQQYAARMQALTIAMQFIAVYMGPTTAAIGNTTKIAQAMDIIGERDGWLVNLAAKAL